MTTNTATITISTTPMIEPATAFARRTPHRHHVGVLARVVAGMTGALLGIAIGLVSAGFDTTQFLLIVGAAALALGWFFSVVADRSNPSSARR